MRSRNAPAVACRDCIPVMGLWPVGQVNTLRWAAPCIFPTSKSRTMCLLCCLLIAVLVHGRMHAQVIDTGEGLLDCDTAYTTLDLGRCSKYRLDTTLAYMQKQVDSIRTNLSALEEEARADQASAKDSQQRAWAEESIARAIEMHVRFEASQAAFMEHVRQERDLLGACYGRGRERIIAENGHQTELVEQRIAALSEWLRSWLQ